ncbi:MAG: AMP-binding protein [Phycisphaerae bacterium]|nr:AMP-binding protein [Phycisphaerae bacterium]
MRTKFRHSTLIELFNTSLDGVERLDKVCLEIVRTERCERLTFENLRTRAQTFAMWLVRAAGICIGDKVAVLGKNRVDWDAAFWGAVLAGAVPVLIDPERGVEGVINHLIHTDTALLVMVDDYLDDESRRELKSFTAEGGLGLVEMAEAPFCDSLGETNGPDADEITSDRSQIDELLEDIAAEVNGEATAVILCTSGTTGDPREVELTHTNLIANIDGTMEKIRITSDDTLGHVLPPHHSFGLTAGKLLTLAVGARNIYTNKYRRISQLIADEHVTIFIAMPALFTVLARKIEENLTAQKKQSRLVRVLDRYLPKLIGRGIVKKQGWEALRFCISGAAPMPKWVLDVFWRRGLLLYEGYGTTENSPVYGFNDDVRRLGSVGKPIPTLDVKIVSEENQTLAPGQKGEILLGGPCIMKGYYENPTATEAAIETDADGIRWLHTGDLGCLDADGNLFITGRKKFLIVLPGGKNVNPELVESALSEAQFVAEILIVPGVKRNSAGVEAETVRAIARPDLDAIKNHPEHSCTDPIDKPVVLKSIVWQSINETQQKSRHLSSYEKISSAGLEIRIEEFQKTSTGKIKRQAYITR